MHRRADGGESYAGPLWWVSAAVTVHFLFGAWVITRLPRWHARFGVGPVAVAGAVVATLGVLGWALCAQRWPLMLAACVSGAGWGAVASPAAGSGGTKGGTAGRILPPLKLDPARRRVAPGV